MCRACRARRLSAGYAEARQRWTLLCTHRVTAAAASNGFIKNVWSNGCSIVGKTVAQCVRTNSAFLHASLQAPPLDFPCTKCSGVQLWHLHQSGFHLFCASVQLQWRGVALFLGPRAGCIAHGCRSQALRWPKYPCLHALARPTCGLMYKSVPF